MLSISRLTMSSAEEECVSLLLATLTTDGKQTAGLTLAARLTEDPSVTVAVLEAGEHNIGEPLIDVPGQFGQTFGNLKVFSEGFRRESQIVSDPCG